MWIGDFVRVHSVVKLLKARWPGPADRPRDLARSALRSSITCRACAKASSPTCRAGACRSANIATSPDRLRAEHYGTALVMPRTWKSALAPFLAGIPERTGFAGEGRFLLINDMRWGERTLERMIDCFGALALPRNATPPADWPLPNIEVPQAELEAWQGEERPCRAVSGPVVAFAPGAVGPGKAWPPERYAELARLLTAAGVAVWVLGGPNEKTIASVIRERGGEQVRDLTGNDLRNAILALKAADIAVTNNSGLMHISAAIGTPTIAIFGPTSPRLWAPLNPLAAVIEPEGSFANIKDRSTAGVVVERVYENVRGALDALPREPAAATRG